MQNQISTTILILLARFEGKLLIPLIPAVESAGFKVQTARNLLSEKCFPIKTELRGSRRFIHISELAKYIDASQSELIVSKRGRPTKISKFKLNVGGQDE